MKTKKLISTILIAIIAILMVTVVLSSVQTVDAAPKKVKITWNANGGKIGKTNTKVTTIKKNAKVAKLLKAPIRNGYVFKGWYTKKIGGKKITVTTKVKNKVIYHAQWKKKSGNTNSSSANKIVGTWTASYIGIKVGINGASSTTLSAYYHFFTNGTFAYVFGSQSYQTIRGKYSTSNGNIYLTNLATDNGIKLKNQQYTYSLGKDDKGEFLLTDVFKQSDNVNMQTSVKFRPFKDSNFK